MLLILLSCEVECSVLLILEHIFAPDFETRDSAGQEHFRPALASRLNRDRVQAPADSPGDQDDESVRGGAADAGHPADEAGLRLAADGEKPGDDGGGCRRQEGQQAGEARHGRILTPVGYPP